MSEFFFVVKTMLITVGIVALLQIKIGQKTIEQRAVGWMHGSVAIEALRGVADGTVVAVENGYTWAKTAVDKQLGKRTESKSQSQKWEKETQSPSGSEVD